MPADPALRPLRSQVVLVHGGWHGGWVWERLTPLLRAQGHVVHAPTLTGLGERSNEFSLEVGFQTHVDDILVTVRSLEAGPLTLVGHSYGGSIITAVADAWPERVDALVYVDALIPTDGVPGWHGFAPERQAQMLAGADGLGGHRVPPPDPSFWGIEVNSEDHRLLSARLTPHPLKTMMDVPRITGRWKGVPTKCYLLAGGPPSSRFVPFHAACRAEQGWLTDIVPGGHDMMWTHPHALLSALLPVMPSVSRVSPTP